MKYEQQPKSKLLLLPVVYCTVATTATTATTATIATTATTAATTATTAIFILTPIHVATKLMLQTHGVGWSVLSSRATPSARHCESPHPGETWAPLWQKKL